MKDKDKAKKVTNEKAVSLFPLKLEDALRGLLAVKPKPETKENSQKDKGKTG